MCSYGDPQGFEWGPIWNIIYENGSFQYLSLVKLLMLADDTPILSKKNIEQSWILMIIQISFQPIMKYKWTQFHPSVPW